jgi:hypothetical protein
MKFAILDFKDLSLKVDEDRSGLMRGIVEFWVVDFLILLNIFNFNN